MPTTTQPVEVFEIYFGNEPGIDATKSPMCRAFDRRSMEAVFNALAFSFLVVEVFDENCTNVRSHSNFG